MRQARRNRARPNHSLDNQCAIARKSRLPLLETNHCSATRDSNAPSTATGLRPEAGVIDRGVNLMHYDGGTGESFAEGGEACLVGFGVVLVPHVGLTTSGTIGASTALTLAEAAEVVQQMRDGAVAVNPDVLVLCHGGPIAEPADAQYILDHTTGIAGFFGASSMERLPTEKAIANQAAAFKDITITSEGDPS
jgi:hypothetical protein